MPFILLYLQMLYCTPVQFTVWPDCRPPGIERICPRAPVISANTYGPGRAFCFIGRTFFYRIKYKGGKNRNGIPLPPCRPYAFPYSKPLRFDWQCQLRTALAAWLRCNQVPDGKAASFPISQSPQMGNPDVPSKTVKHVLPGKLFTARFTIIGERIAQSISDLSPRP